MRYSDSETAAQEMNDLLEAKDTEIEALRWLIEVMSLYADECCNLCWGEFQKCACDELRATHIRALLDAGYGVESDPDEPEDERLRESGQFGVGA